MGGVIVGYAMARALGVDDMFVERPQGVFELRRGIRLEPGQPVLMMEDVITTGRRSRETTGAVQAGCGPIVAAACLVDTYSGPAHVGVPLVPLLRLAVTTPPPHT